MTRSLSAFSILLAFQIGTAAADPLANKKPNIVFVLTDDQGYGDLSCHGNPTLKTPNLDRLHDEGVPVHRLPRQPNLLADTLRPHDRPT